MCVSTTFKLVFIFNFFKSDFIYSSVTGLGEWSVEAPDWLALSANESLYSDRFLLDVAGLFMSSYEF